MNELNSNNPISSPPPSQNQENKVSLPKKFLNFFVSKGISNSTEEKIPQQLSSPVSQEIQRKFNAVKQDISNVLGRFKEGISLCYNGIEAKVKMSKGVSYAQDQIAKLKLSNLEKKSTKLDEAFRKATEECLTSLGTLERANHKGTGNLTEKVYATAEGALKKWQELHNEISNFLDKNISTQNEKLQGLRETFRNEIVAIIYSDLPLELHFAKKTLDKTENKQALNKPKEEKVSFFLNSYDQALFDCKDALAGLKAENQKETVDSTKLSELFSTALKALNNFKVEKRKQSSPMEQSDLQKIVELNNELKIAALKMPDNHEAVTLLAAKEN